MTAPRFSWFAASFVLLMGCAGAPVIGQSSGTPKETREAGRAAIAAHDFKRAERVFAALVAREPSSANFADLAAAELAAGDVDQAVSHAQRAEKLGNDSASLHYTLRPC